MTKRDFFPDSYKNLHNRDATHSNGVGPIATCIGRPTASVTAIMAQLATVSTGHGDLVAALCQTRRLSPSTTTRPQAREYMTVPSSPTRKSAIRATLRTRFSKVNPPFFAT
jgi:hypothetical protein